MSTATAVPKSGEVYYAEDGTVSIVMDDHFDPNYEPPQKEILEYAKWLGIDTEAEKDLLWIARDGLKAPLPKEWKPCKTDTGEVYYFNFKTGDSIWDHPMDDVYKKKVEEERAKSKSTGVGAKSKPLVKGAAGASDAAHAGSAKPMSRTAIEEVRPKSGRLGAIGSSDEQKSIRPDISALLPSKSEQLASTLLGPKKKEPLRDTKEIERNFRKRYESEFEAIRNTLQEKHEKQITELKQQLAAELKKVSNDLKRDAEDEIETAQRNGERRNKREVQLYEDSLQKQKEDLQRTLKSTQEKLDQDTAGVARRVDVELGERRTATEKQLASDIGRRRQELQEAWQREKANTELETQSKLRDLRTAHELRVERLRQQEVQALSQRVQQLEDQLVHEVATVKAQIQSERSAHSESLLRLASDASGAANAAFNVANAQYLQAVADAKGKHEEMLNRERMSHAAAMETLRAEYDAKKTEAERQAAAAVSGASSAEAAIAARKSYSEKRIDDAQRELETQFEKDKQTFEAETSSLVAAVVARVAAVQQAGTAATGARDVAAAKHQALEQRRVQSEQLEIEHQRRLDTMRADHQLRLNGGLSGSAAGAGFDPRSTAEYAARFREAVSQWEAANPAAIYHLPTLPPVPTFDPNAQYVVPVVVQKETELAPTPDQIAALVSAEANAARMAAERDADSKIEAARQVASASLQAEFDAHRLKATADMRERLVAYRAAGGSPLRAASRQSATKAPPPPNLKTTASSDAVELVAFPEADRQIRELRSLLQARYQQLVARLAAQASAVEAEAVAAQQELAALAQAVATAQQPQSHVRPESAMSQSMTHAAKSASSLLQRAQTADAAYFSEPPEVLRAGHNFPPPPPAPFAGGTPSGSPSKRPSSRKSTFEERFAKAHELLSHKKREIRARQQRLEEVRTDWKHDMAAARAARDEVQIATLKRVAEVLELDAKQLNREALALKESSQWLKREGEAFFRAHGSPSHAAARPSGVPAAVDGLVAAPSSTPGDALTIEKLLSALVEKTEAVEHRMQLAEAQQIQASPTKHRHRHRDPSSGDVPRDATYEKWTSWLRTQPAPGSAAVVVEEDRLASTAPAGAYPELSPKKRTVEKWVQDQQRRR